MSVYDIKPSELIEKLASHLKTKINMPDWATFVKTSPGKERPPEKEDWYYIRAAAILRKIYMSKGPIGVNKLRTKFGNLKNRGTKPEKFYRSSGKIIRSILQQFEKNKLLEQKAIGVHKGRVLTNEGKSLLDKLSKK